MIQAKFICRYIGASNNKKVIHLISEGSSTSQNEDIPAGTVSLYVSPNIPFEINKTYILSIEEDS